MFSLAKPAVRRAFHRVGRFPPIAWAARHWQGNAAILGYHRIVPDDDYFKMTGPYRELSCPVSQFRYQMTFLRAHYRLVSMDELYKHIKCHESGFVVAVTFDDGYRDNYSCALTVLEKFEIPATIFVATRFPEGDTSMWWFDLWDEIFRRDNLVALVDGQELCYSTETIRQKQRVYHRLKKIVMGLSEVNVWEWLSGVKGSAERTDYSELVCNWDILGELAASPLISIGAHTHNHSVLSLCSDSELIGEMKTCKQLLEDKLDVEVKHLAYPYGRRVHAGEREYQAAMVCGFQSGATTIPSKIDNRSLYCLGRHLPQNFSLNHHLINKLEGWNNLFGLPI